MSTNKARPTWPTKHFVHAFWFEKFVGLLAFVGGWAISWFAPSDWLMYFGFIVCAFGANAVLPSSRPLFSYLVDRLPFLASKDKED